MKKTWLLLVTLALLLTGCAQQSRHPEWDEEWTRFGDLMAVEAPEGFAPGEYNDVLSLNGIWYATWISGEARSVQTAEGEEATAYDAQLYLLIRECGSEDEATPISTTGSSGKRRATKLATLTSFPLPDRTFPACRCFLRAQRIPIPTARPRSRSAGIWPSAWKSSALRALTATRRNSWSSF